MADTVISAPRSNLVLGLGEDGLFHTWPAADAPPAIPLGPIDTNNPQALGKAFIPVDPVSLQNTAGVPVIQGESFFLGPLYLPPGQTLNFVGIATPTYMGRSIYKLTTDPLAVDEQGISKFLRIELVTPPGQETVRFDLPSGKFIDLNVNFLTGTNGNSYNWKLDQTTGQMVAVPLNQALNNPDKPIIAPPSPPSQTPAFPEFGKNFSAPMMRPLDVVTSFIAAYKLGQTLGAIPQAITTIGQQVGLFPKPSNVRSQLHKVNKQRRKRDKDIIIYSMPKAIECNASEFGQPTPVPPKPGPLGLLNSGNPEFAQTVGAAQGMSIALNLHPAISETTDGPGGIDDTTNFTFLMTWSGVNYYVKNSDPLFPLYFNPTNFNSWAFAVAEDTAQQGKPVDKSGQFFRNSYFSQSGSTPLYVQPSQTALNLSLLLQQGPFIAFPGFDSAIQFAKPANPINGSPNEVIQFIRLNPGSRKVDRDTGFTWGGSFPPTQRSKNFNEAWWVPSAIEPFLAIKTPNDVICLKQGIDPTTIKSKKPSPQITPLSYPGAVFGGGWAYGYPYLRTDIYFDPFTKKPRPFGGYQFGMVYFPGPGDPPIDRTHWLQCVGSDSQLTQRYFAARTPGTLTIWQSTNGAKFNALDLVPKTADNFGLYWMMDVGGDAGNAFYDLSSNLYKTITGVKPGNKGGGAAGPGVFSDQPRVSIGTLINDPNPQGPQGQLIVPPGLGITQCFFCCNGWWIDAQRNIITTPLNSDGANFSPIAISTTGFVYQYVARQSSKEILNPTSVDPIKRIWVGQA